MQIKDTVFFFQMLMNNMVKHTACWTLRSDEVRPERNSK